MARCPKVNRDLPPRFAKQPCLETAEHSGNCRFELNETEINALFEGEKK